MVYLQCLLYKKERDHAYEEETCLKDKNYFSLVDDVSMRSDRQRLQSQ